MKTVEKHIIIQTDKYTGNFDADLVSRIFGNSDDRSLGENLKAFKKQVTPEETEQHFMGFLTTRPVDEYGYMLYQINNDFKDGYNSLEVFVHEYSHDRIESTIQFMKDRFGDEVELYDWKNKPFTVKILGYHVKTIVSETGIEKI